MRPTSEQQGSGRSGVDVSRQHPVLPQNPAPLQPRVRRGVVTHSGECLEIDPPALEAGPGLAQPAQQRPRLQYRAVPKTQLPLEQPLWLAPEQCPPADSPGSPFV